MDEQFVLILFFMTQLLNCTTFEPQVNMCLNSFFLLYNHTVTAAVYGRSDVVAKSIKNLPTHALNSDCLFYDVIIYRQIFHSVNICLIL